MSHLKKRRSVSWNGISLKLENFKSYTTFSQITNFNKRLSIPNNYKNINNNTVCTELNICPTSDIKENSINVCKTPDPFNFYLKLINQLRFNRNHRLRSVSCQSENKSTLKTQSSEMHPECRAHVNDKSTNQKSYSANKIVNRKPENQKFINSFKYLYSSYDTIHNSYGNHKKLSTVGLMNNDTRFKQLEKMVKTIAEKINYNQTVKEIDLLEQQFLKTNKKLKLRVSTKSVQVKANTHSKSVHINELDLMNCYINTLADFISITVITDLQKCVHYQFCDYFLRQKSLGYRNSVRMLLNVEGDCEVHMKTSTAQLLKDHEILNSMRIENPHQNSFISLNGVNDMDFQTKLKALDNFADNTSEIISTVDEFHEDTNQDIVVKISKPSNGIDDEECPCFIENSTKSRLKRIEVDVNSLSVDKNHIQTSKIISKSKQLSTISTSSSDNSLLDAISTLAVIDNYSYKHRTNCYSILKSEIEQITVNEFRPIVQNDVSQVQFQLKPHFTTPIITFDQYSESISSKINNNHLDNKGKIINILNPDENCMRTNIPVGCNQSQSDRESTRNFLLGYVNCNQSQCDNKRNLVIQENTKQSAKITLINPFKKYPKLKVLKKCNHIFEEKCVPISSRFNAVDDLIDRANSKAKIINQFTYCSEHRLSFAEIDNSKDFTISWTSIKSLNIILHSDSKVLFSKSFMDSNGIKTLFCNLSKSYSNNVIKTYRFSNDFVSKTSLIKIISDTPRLNQNHIESKTSRLIGDKEPFPNRCGIKSLYRAIFQSWIFQ